MTDIKLFSVHDGLVGELPGSAAALEKSIQQLFERNLGEMFAVKFLRSEYRTGPRHGGRIDTLGIDENSNPVIIEYKRATNENVINQGLFYLDWLLDHRAEFELLVLKELGEEAAAAIDWSAPRLLCIAGGFTRYDAHAVEQMNRNIELIRYRHFGDGLLMLELVNMTQANVEADNSRTPAGPASTQKSIGDTLAALEGSLQDLYEALRAHVLALGDDIQEKQLKFYVAFKRLRNFACVEVHPNKATIVVYLKVDPTAVSIESGFTRDVRKIGHYGTGDLEVTLHSKQDLERAMTLLQQSYESS